METMPQEAMTGEGTQSHVQNLSKGDM